MRLSTRTATVRARMMGTLSSVLRAGSRGTEPISSKPQPRPLWRQTITDRSNVSVGTKAGRVAGRRHRDER